MAILTADGGVHTISSLVQSTVSREAGWSRNMKGLYQHQIKYSVPYKEPTNHDLIIVGTVREIEKIADS
jgi:hypothetical protein